MPAEEKIQEDSKPEETEQPTTVEETETEKVDEVEPAETEKVTEKETAEVKAEIDPDDIEKDEDGKFVFKVDPSDPKTTVYKGTTRKELFEHIAKGVKDKDIYIKDLKARQLNEEVRHKPEADEQVSAPDYRKTLDATLKELGIEREMLGWDKDKWREYEAENGAVYALKMMNLVDGAQALAREQVDKESIAYQNDITLKSEIEQVIEDVKESGVDFTREDLRSVLDSIEKDKTSYRENGIRKQGIIVRKCGIKIRELVKDKAVQDSGKKKAEESAINREKKTEVTTVGKNKGKIEVKKASPKNFDQATEQILEEYIRKK